MNFPRLVEVLRDHIPNAREVRAWNGPNGPMLRVWYEDGDVAEAMIGETFFTEVPLQEFFPTLIQVMSEHKQKPDGHLGPARSG